MQISSVPILATTSLEKPQNTSENSLFTLINSIKNLKSDNLNQFSSNNKFQSVSNLEYQTDLMPLQEIVSLTVKISSSRQELIDSAGQALEDDVLSETDYGTLLNLLNGFMPPALMADNQNISSNLYSQFFERLQIAGIIKKGNALASLNDANIEQPLLEHQQQDFVELPSSINTPYVQNETLPSTQTIIQKESFSDSTPSIKEPQVLPEAQTNAQENSKEVSKTTFVEVAKEQVAITKKPLFYEPKASHNEVIPINDTNDTPLLNSVMNPSSVKPDAIEAFSVLEPQTPLIQNTDMADDNTLTKSLISAKEEKPKLLIEQKNKGEIVQKTSILQADTSQPVLSKPIVLNEALKALPDQEVVWEFTDTKVTIHIKNIKAENGTSPTTTTLTSNALPITFQGLVLKERLTKASQQVIASNLEAVVDSTKIKSVEVDSSTPHIVPSGNLKALELKQEGLVQITSSVYNAKVDADKVITNSQTKTLNIERMITPDSTLNTDSSLLFEPKTRMNTASYSIDNTQNVSSNHILERINQVAMVQKIGERLQASRIHDTGLVQMRLDPPELGRLIVKLSLHEKEMKISILAENANTSDMLKHHKHIFLQTMKNNGLEITDFNVQLHNDFSNQTGSHANENRGQFIDQPKKNDIKIDSKQETTSVIDKSLKNNHLNDTEHQISLIA